MGVDQPTYDPLKLQQQLILHEGQRLKPYRDTVGKLTIGVGRNLDDVGISKSESLYLLDNDIARVVSDLDSALPWWRQLSPTRQLVLLDMCFNLGLSRLLKFSQTLAALKLGDYGAAANGMLNSRWAGQVGVRATTLAAMMRQG